MLLGYIFTLTFVFDMIVGMNKLFEIRCISKNGLFEYTNNSYKDEYFNAIYVQHSFFCKTNIFHHPRLMIYKNG